MSSQNVAIKENEHVFIAGTTGTGKSTFAEVYLSHYKYVVKLDSKREFEERRIKGQSAWMGLVEGKDFTIVEYLEDLPAVETPKIIYAPVFEEQNKEYYNEFFRWCFERQNNIVWVDELLSIVNGQVMPPQFRRIMTQGRSKNVGCWNCTQRPTGLPMIIPANTSHFIGYYMPWLEDRKKMYSFTGCREFLSPPDKAKFEFWYTKAGSGKAVKRRIRIK